MNELLRYQQLKKTVHGRLLFDIDELIIKEQTCVALSGRNGVGKSTLLRIIAGLDKPDSVTVSFLGQTLPWRRTQQSIRTHVIYLHQTPFLFDRTVNENVAYGLRCVGLKSKDLQLRVAEVLKWAKLDHLANRNARELSGGERQRVALARARSLSPKVLLLDEPTASMDSEAREQTWRMIKQLKEDNVSIIMSTHEYQSIAHLCDEHLLLQDGALIAQSDLNDDHEDNVISYNERVKPA